LIAMLPSLKLPLDFDVKAMQNDLSYFALDDWTPHFNTSYYEGDWSGIALRAARGAHVELYPDPSANEGYVNTAMLARCSYLPQVLNAFKCEVESARLLRLAAGSSIREHRDYKLTYEDGVARIHIPIQTNQRVQFFLNKELIGMKEGEAWYLNLNLLHSVNNNGETARVHLVLDCIVNDWLSRFFTAHHI
jgi:hypothetical protein